MAKPKSIITPTAVKTSVNNEPVQTTVEIEEHLKNKDIHVDQNLRDSINYARKDIESHISDQDIHISSKEKDTWNNKESQQGAQAKANKVMSSLQNHTNDNTVHLTKTEKELFKDKYTRSETRNLLKHSLTGLVFLKSVFNRSELNTKYPDPKFNSCVYLRESKMSVIFNGTEWVDSNVIFAPEVTEELDGLMTKEDKIKLDSIEEGANKYIHPDNVDTRHVTDAQIDYWDNKADNLLSSKFSDGLMTKEDKIKLDTVEEGANKYTHPDKHEPSDIKQDENNRFVSDEEKTKWNEKVDSTYVDEVANKTLVTTKSIVDTKMANMFNTSEAQLEILRSLAFELKQDDVVKQFMDLYNECAKTIDLNDHILNDKIHLDRNDIALLENVKNLLETEIPSIEIPKKLPADGGNADTVGNYRPEELLNNKSFYDYTIGDSQYKETEVSIVLDDTFNIDDIISKLNRNRSCNVLFRQGIYLIDKEIIIKASNKVISGIGDKSILSGVTIKIIGDNNVIENITLSKYDGKFINTTAIVVEGNNNIIRNNTISKYDVGISIEGSNNKIEYNNLTSIRYEAISLTANDNSNYDNYINGNNIKNSEIGIKLLSSKNILSRNHITSNNIANCNLGIVLSNTNGDITKTIMNFICQNFIIKGTGEASEYLSGHATIISEFSSKNIISQNITSGKEIFAPNDALSENIF